MKYKFLIAGILVKWTLMFAPAAQPETWEKKERVLSFQTMDQVINFTDNAPAQGHKFACNDNDTGRRGTCVMLNVVVGL